MHLDVADGKGGHTKEFGEAAQKNPKGVRAVGYANIVEMKIVN